jgi:O-succinylbenzoic acid--CoA ligase
MAEAYYSPLPTVKLSLTEDDCLLVSAPHLGEEAFATNDRAELSADGRFRILGRKDNVVNSGGVKLQIEQLEDKLRPAMPAPFALSSTPDPALGEALVLLIEEGDYDLKELQASLAALLPRYERPRHIRQIASIPLAGNGKIDRAALKTYQK